MRKFKIIVKIFSLIVICFFLACNNLNINPQDKQLVVTINDFINNNIIKNNKDFYKYETYEKDYFFDGSYELDYVFDFPVKNDNQADIYIHCTATIETTSSSNFWNEFFEGVGEHLFLKKNKSLISKNRNDLFKFGKKSTLIEYKAKVNKDIVAYYFRYKTSKRFYSFIVTGIDLSQKEQWNKILLPKLEKFKKIESGFFYFDYNYK